MLLREFPRLDVPSSERHAFFRAYGRENVVIHAQGEERAYEEHPGPLSIKWTPRGRERYWVAGLPLVVESGQHLVLNDRTRYASEVDAAEPCESLAVFFGRGFAEQALASAACESGLLLDDPERSRAVTFIEHVSQGPGPVRVVLQRLRLALSRHGSEGLWFDELCHALIDALLVEQRRLTRRALALSAVKRSTRLELYARVTRARDFLLGSYEQPLRLRQLARAAAMSPHHFLRVFKEAFGATPAQLLSQRRLEVAAQLLRDPRVPVDEVAARIGFENHSAFSRRFRHTFGTSPSRYRLQFRNPGTAKLRCGR